MQYFVNYLSFKLESNEAAWSQISSILLALTSQSSSVAETNENHGMERDAKQAKFY